MQVQVTGFVNSKTVLVKGVYPVVKKQAKTIIKDQIRKTLKMKNYRSFYLGKMDELKITGDTIQII